MQYTRSSHYKYMYIYKFTIQKHVYIIFHQSFSEQKMFFRTFRKNLAETIHYIPKVLCEGNPFHGPFAQLSYII